MNCITALSNFDSNLHYLKVDNNYNQLIICNKKDLSWKNRLMRFFWKPETERIVTIAKVIFQNLSETHFEQQSLDPQTRSRVFKNLCQIAMKGDRKSSSSRFYDTVYALQNQVCGKLYMANYVGDLATRKGTLTTEISTLEANINTARTTLGAVSGQATAAREELSTLMAIGEARTTLNTLSGQVTAARGELSTLTANTTALQAQNQTTTSQHQAELRQLTTEITTKRELRKYLESDTVIWTDDGYVLCSSKSFSKESPVQASNVAAMSGRSQAIQQKLGALPPERSAALNALPRHFYIPDAQAKHVRVFVRMLELGSSAIAKYSREERIAVGKIADYLLEKVPKPQSDLRRQLNETSLSAQQNNSYAKEEIETLGDKISSLREKLSSLKRRIGFLRNMAYSIGIFENSGISDDFKEALRRVISMNLS